MIAAKQDTCRECGRSDNAFEPEDVSASDSNELLCEELNTPDTDGSLCCNPYNNKKFKLIIDSSIRVLENKDFHALSVREKDLFNFLAHFDLVKNKEGFVKRT